METETKGSIASAWRDDGVSTLPFFGRARGSRRWCVAGVAVLGTSVIAACAAAPPPPKPVPVGAVQSTKREEPDRALPRPKLAQRAGRLTRSQRAPLVLEVSGKEVTSDGYYVAVDYAGRPHGAIFQSYEPCGDPTPGPRVPQIVELGMGAEALGSALTVPNGALLVRFPGSSEVPDSLDLVLRGCPEGTSTRYGQQSGFERQAALRGIKAAPTQPGIAAAFLRKRGYGFRRLTDIAPSQFGPFAEGRLLQVAESLMPRPPRGGQRKPGKRPDILDWLASYERSRFGSDDGTMNELFDFYTGRSQVLEAMAARRGLGRVAPGRASIPIAGIEGVTLPPRDYAALSQALGGKSPVLDPLSRHLPADMLVLEFASLRDLIVLSRRLDEHLGVLVQTMEGRGGPDWLLQRYRDQLALHLDGLAEKVGHVAVGAVAVVTSDPYLREGSDVSLLLEAKNRAVLESALEAHAVRAAQEHLNLTRSQVSLGGRTVALLQTPDGAVRRYQAALPGLVILSNSPAAMAHLFAVQDGAAGQLAQAADYRYARTVKPFAAGAEAAFLFLGDGFMTNVTSPRSKILESRRVRAQLELQAVNWAALLYGWMQGQRPTSLRELLDSPWLGPNDLRHFDGSPIEWSPEEGSSSHWGKPFQLTPIADEVITQVSAQERDAYQEFRRGYESGWRGGVDPTLVRVLPSDGGRELEIDLTVLPINQLSRSDRAYEEMARMVGQGAVTLDRFPDGATFTLAIGKGSELRKMAEHSLQLFGSGHEIKLSFVGDWLQVGASDRAALWDVLLTAEGREFSFRDSEHSAPGDATRRARSLEALLGTLPLWAELHITNRLTLAATLTAARALVDEAAPGLVSWVKAKPYRGVAITRVDIREEEIPAALHYGVVGQVLVLALQREVLEERIDQILNGAVPTPVDIREGYQAFTTLTPHAQGVMRQIAALYLDHQALRAHHSAAQGFELLRRGLGFETIQGSELRTQGLRYLGFEPRSPQGGDLRWTSEGIVDHDAYGSELEPRIPDATAPGLALHGVLDSILSVLGGAKIEGRGSERELHGKVRLRFRD